jgi:hypothetical protein
MDTEVLQSYLNQVTKLLERLVQAVEQISLDMDVEKPEPLAALPSSHNPTQTIIPLKTFAEDVANWLCPIHHDFKVVPAGVSRKTGLPYTSFIACSSPGCNEKPPRFSPAQQQMQKLP